MAADFRTGTPNSLPMVKKKNVFKSRFMLQAAKGNIYMQIKA